MTDSTLTRKEFAEKLGCRPSYVTQLIKDGRIVLTADGKRILVDASIERIEATRDPSKAATAARHAQKRGQASVDPETETSDPDEEDTTFANAKGRREHYLALAAKRDYEISMGSLLSTKDVQAVLSEASAHLRQRFEQLPAILAPQVIEAAARGEHEVVLLIDEALTHALGECSRTFLKLGDGDGTGG